MTKPMTDARLAELEDAGRGDVHAFTLRECLREIRRLREELKAERQFCICGCAMQDHENYGEDGFGCGGPHHECVLVSAAAAEIAKGLRGENKRLVKKTAADTAEHALPLIELVERLKSKNAKLHKEHKLVWQEVNRLRQENEEYDDELAKLRKVVEAAKPCVEKDTEGAFTLILYDYDPDYLDRLGVLDEALRELEVKS